MSDVAMTTLVGVLGTGLIGMFFMQLQNMRSDLKELAAEVKDLAAEVKVLGAEMQNLNQTLKSHGRRLARVEAKLDIDPPAEAA